MQAIRTKNGYRLGAAPFTPSVEGMGFDLLFTLIFETHKYNAGFSQGKYKALNAYVKAGLGKVSVLSLMVF